MHRWYAGGALVATLDGGPRMAPPLSIHELERTFDTNTAALEAYFTIDRRTSSQSWQEISGVTIISATP